MRICARCGQEQAVAPGEPLWPLGWRCEGCGWQVGAAGAVAAYASEPEPKRGLARWFG